MNYIRTLCFGVITGFGGYYVVNSYSNKMLKVRSPGGTKRETNIYFQSLYTSLNTRLCEYLFKRITDQYKINLLSADRKSRRGYYEITQRDLYERFYADADDDEPASPKFEFNFGSRNLPPNTDPRFPTLSYFNYRPDCILYCDTRTRSPYWTVEKINKNNVDELEHLHGEEFRITALMNDAFRYGDPNNDRRFRIMNILNPIHLTDPETHEVHCNYCLKTPVRKTFYDCVRNFAKEYDETEVWSGTLFSVHDDFALPLPTGYSQREINPTHFFKVIRCKMEDGKHRAKCFKFRYDDDRVLSSDHYDISLKTLEEQSGIPFFRCPV